MENEQTCFQLALKQTDEKLTAIDREHEALHNTLTKLNADKSVLLNTQKALRIQLGEIPPQLPSGPDGNAASKNQFKGMGQAAAARKYLAEVGHSKTHAELIDALLKRKFKTQSKRPSDSLRMAMQARPDWFRWIKRPGDRGRWELVEWPVENSNPNPALSNPETPNLSLVK